MSKNTEGKGKVKTVQGNGGGPGSFMDLYKFEVTMEDGTTGNMFKKTDNPYIGPGDEVQYTINAKGTNSTTLLSRDELIVRQTCIKAAVDFCKNANCSPEEVTENAQIFRDWVFTEKLPVKTNGQTNDVPF